MVQNAFRNVTCERPPRPRLFGTGPFLDGAATPPWQGGEYARLDQSVRIPPLGSRGGFAITTNSRSHRSAAARLLAHPQLSQTPPRTATPNPPPPPHPP